MCTITFMARADGYALGMNRDENLARALALPPERHRLGSRDALFPRQPGCGTWIGVNDSAVTLALVNWYAVPARVGGQAVSRGEVVESALTADSSCAVARALALLPLACVNPFRLIGVFLASRAVVEWRWNLRRLERFDHPWQTHIWVSSGFDEPGAQQTRGKTFGESLRRSSAGGAAWLRQLHRSHAPERGPYSICMHRHDAATVSYTEVIVSPSATMMRYQAGPPCCGAPASVHSLNQ